ncbi:hypothetical protein RR48_12358 [Papilio machaon]|uniref:Uncharacterized protein n=1 Tax=Papilio machaon TaxID=76193 RepID=A0A194QUE8_PAPMA|nr:hypothetical protein RR48_12358 [Papilio machaon]
MRNLCRPKQLEIELYFNRLRETYDAYEEHHNPIIGHYRMLREKDDFYQRDIARNERLIEQATDILLNLQKEWVRTTKSISNKINRLTNHKEDLAKKYWLMKKESKLMSCRDSDMLTVLVNCSQDTIKNECKAYMKMDKFLNKVNRVKVQTMCLRAEKAKLAKENVQLKQYIKKYLTELALNGSKDRPASMKYTAIIQKTDENGRTLYRPVTCIEGALSNAVLYEKRLKLQEKRDKELGIRAYPRVCW